MDEVGMRLANRSKMERKRENRSVERRERIDLLRGERRKV